MTGVDHVQIVAVLRSRRIALGLSQAAVARRAGVSPGTVSVWEKDKFRPGLPETVAWADALGCELILRERG